MQVDWVYDTLLLKTINIYNITNITADFLFQNYFDALFVNGHCRMTLKKNKL